MYDARNMSVSELSQCFESNATGNEFVSAAVGGQPVSSSSSNAGFPNVTL